MYKVLASWLDPFARFDRVAYAGALKDSMTP